MMMEDVQMEEISVDSGFCAMSPDLPQQPLPSSHSKLLKPLPKRVEIVRNMDGGGECSGEEGDRSGSSQESHPSKSFFSRPYHQDSSSGNESCGSSRSKPLSSLASFFNRLPPNGDSDSGESGSSKLNYQCSKPAIQPKKATRKSRKPEAHDKSQTKMDTFVRELKRAPAPKIFDGPIFYNSLESSKLNTLLFKSPSSPLAPRKKKESPKFLHSSRDPTRPSPRRSLELDVGTSPLFPQQSAELRKDVCRSLDTSTHSNTSSESSSYNFRKKIHGGTELKSSKSSCSTRNGPITFQKKQRSKPGAKRQIAALASDSITSVSSRDSRLALDGSWEQPKRKRVKTLHEWTSDIPSPRLMNAPLNGSISNPSMAQSAPIFQLSEPATSTSVENQGFRDPVQDPMDMDLLKVDMGGVICHSSPIATRSSSSRISAGVEASFAAEEEALRDFEVHGKNQLMSQFLEDLERSNGFYENNELEDSLRELQAIKAISLL